MSKGKYIRELPINISWCNTLPIIDTPVLKSLIQPDKLITIVLPDNNQHRTTIDKQCVLLGEISSSNRTELQLNLYQSNPIEYMYLHDNTHIYHQYFQWKLYTLLHGDTVDNWRTTIYECEDAPGVYIQPPPIIQSNNTIASDIISNTLQSTIRNKTLNESDETRLMELLRNVTTDKLSCSTVVQFLLSHCNEAYDCTTILCDSLTITTTSLISKLARLYVLSDVLYNCSNINIRNVSLYRTAIQSQLFAIFASFHELLQLQSGRISQNTMKDKVINVINTWSTWNIYSNEVIQKCIDIFIYGNNNTDSTTPPDTQQLNNK